MSASDGQVDERGTVLQLELGVEDDIDEAHVGHVSKGMPGKHPIRLLLVPGEGPSHDCHLASKGYFETVKRPVDRFRDIEISIPLSNKEVADLTKYVSRSQMVLYIPPGSSHVFHLPRSRKNITTQVCVFEIHQPVVPELRRQRV